MPLAQLNLEGKTKAEVAIARIQEFQPPEGYYLAFSGGKDSIVIYSLAVRARVIFDAHYSQGGIDPPELVKFIRWNYPDVIFDKPPKPFFKQLLTKGMPHRKSRWCCQLIKEHHGSGRRVITGIRWAEGTRRRQRRLVEICHSDKTKIFVNPIIDWADSEVWEYIRQHSIKYCSLYDEGFSRLGCVLCPMTSAKETQRHLLRFPKMAEAWRRACYRLYEARKARGNPSFKRWPDAESFWQWWLSRKGEPKINESQCIMFDN